MKISNNSLHSHKNCEAHLMYIHLYISWADLYLQHILFSHSSMRYSGHRNNYCSFNMRNTAATGSDTLLCNHRLEKVNHCCSSASCGLRNCLCLPQLALTKAWYTLSVFFCLTKQDKWKTNWGAQEDPALLTIWC